MSEDQIIYGIHAVTALLKNRRRITKKLYISQERFDKRLQSLVELANYHQIPLERLSTQTMKTRFANFNHQGVIAQAEPLPSFGEESLTSLLENSKKPTLVLILDGITDPHNLGACLRTADASGVDFVIMPKDRAASFSAVVSKIACGAAESIPVVRVTNLVRAMELIKQQGVWIYGAAGESKKMLYSLDLKISLALVMGAEGTGMRRLTRDHCDDLFALPMLGSVESLNVSVATAVSLYEVVRQRLK